MNSKKIVKWSVIISSILIASLTIAPFLFKDSIKLLVTKTINEQVRAKVSFRDASLSLFRDFPKARVTIHDFIILNEAPFKGDSLFYASKIHAKISLGELFKSSSESINITSISAINSALNIRINAQGYSNFDIVKNEAPSASTLQENKSASLKIQAYAVQNLQFSFIDKSTNIEIRFKDFNHSGKGDFTSESLDANTKTNTLVSIDLDGINYMKNTAVSLDAIVGINFKKNTYSFKDNTAIINQLPLEFNGDIQLLEDRQLFNLKFKTPSSSFKNMLALMPKKYIGDLNDIKTAGDFNLNGTINGILSAEKVPKFNINFDAANAMFQYNALPKAIRNIAINTQILNTTGNLNDTKIKIHKLGFAIDKDTFETRGKIYNILKNPKVSLSLKGTIDLGNIAKAYPINEAENINGTLQAALSTTFDMESIENENYTNIQNKGRLNLQNFTYDDAVFSNTFFIDQMSLSFDENTIKLSAFDAKTGDSDMHITGNLSNFYGYLFKNKTLKGNFLMNSELLKISDFMASTSQHIESTTTADSLAPLKIPNFINCSLTASAKKVIYDDLTLSNVAGTLLIKNQTVALEAIKMELFDGEIDLNGFVSTKSKTPIFNTKLKFNGLNIADSFSKIEILTAIAPIGKAVEGKLNSTINLSGNLTENMTPDIASISGDVLGELIDSKITTQKSKLLSSLSSEMKFLEASKFNLKDVKAFLSFKDGTVIVEPFQLKYQDIEIQVSGTHGFDQQMNYQLTFDVPTKYFGAEVSKYVSKLSSANSKKITTVPVSAVVSGTFIKPLIATDMKQAASNLLTKLVEQEKETLISKGTATLKNILNGNKKAKDSSKIKKATNILKGLFGNKKKNKK